jgi:hypothetical protein
MEKLEEKVDKGLLYLGDSICLVAERIACVEKGEPMTRERLLERLEEIKPKSKQEKIEDACDLLIHSLSTARD